MASLPWSVLTGGEIDVKHAHEVLDEDHYDLESEGPHPRVPGRQEAARGAGGAGVEVQDAAAEAEVPGPNAPGRGRV